MQRGVKVNNKRFKVVTGNWRARDEKAYGGEPETLDSGDPVAPAFVLKHTPPKNELGLTSAHAVWLEYMEMRIGKRILTREDSRTFGLYCVMCADIENAIILGLGTPNAAHLAQYRMYAELFGLVPAGRARLKERPNVERPKSHKDGGKGESEKANSETQNAKDDGKENYFDD